VTDDRPTPGPRDGGRLLVDQLRAHGIDRVFCVPGESYLPVLDALHDVADDVALTVCRHEANAANMADAYGKLTGRPGVCFVTRGPGATQASVGLHTAFQDSTPLLLFVGQVSRGHLGREAFQEMDHRRVFDEMAKWVVELDDARRIPELMSRAVHTAVSGRPGPVVVVLPEDVLTQVHDVPDVPPLPPTRGHPGPDELARVRELLTEAERPLVLVGGGSWEQATSDALRRFVTANDLPVVATFRRQDHLDNRDERYVGVAGLAIDPALAARIREADLILAIGARLGDATTGGYTLLEPPRPHQRLIHVHPDPDELGRVYAADLLVAAGPAEFVAGLATLEPIESPPWAAWRRAARADHLDFIAPVPLGDDVTGVDLGAALSWLDERLPDDAIVTNGAGNYTVWLHRHLRFSRVRTQLAPTSGAMGYGTPAAIAAKAVHPNRTVVGFAGDGCFLMSGQELATAMMYELPVVFVVVNNAMYGTIRMHQERHYPGRAYGVDLVNPDFAAMARSFGAHGEVVERTDDFPAAFERALACGLPAVVEVRTDGRQLAPTVHLADLDGSPRA
jgi:acetolactate synthase I/II/III large subunit